MNELENTLAHFGVKGMKWGVRKANRPTEVSIFGKPGGRLQVEGGFNRLPSDDAARVAAYKQIAKKNKVASLSNKELQDVVTRMNLEQQYSRLSTQNSALAKGVASTRTILSAGKTVNEALQFANSPVGGTIKLALKSKNK